MSKKEKLIKDLYRFSDEMASLSFNEEAVLEWSDATKEAADLLSNKLQVREAYEHTICNQCHKNAEYICELSPNFLFAKIDGKYCIIQEPCHDHIVWTWPFTPEIEPDETFELEADKWFHLVRAWEPELLGLEHGWWFVEACKVAGYDPAEDGIIKYWITDWAGKQLKNFQ